MPSRERVPILDEPHQRLTWARERAGFNEAVDAARRFHWIESTYHSHENGTRGISKKAAPKYARAFKVTVDWLLNGDSMTAPDPELATLWDNLTEDQQKDLKRYMKWLAQSTAA